MASGSHLLSGAAGPETRHGGRLGTKITKITKITEQNEDRENLICFVIFVIFVIFVPSRQP
jgi:hypothetical protein